ncbi:Regulatory protein TetR [Pedobacter cryoconitis]|uniref:Regulatory protein TetR n=1 Tax=Pedobacter cryoconitis TaxID=188932 RepID=A0A127VE41_9SPHI|nr:TetR/AcrR family transcriptional regulator [Pedobacter cryoconitis]AMP99507.1 Regulatory protein TetR [Pedobacter cryoconitis]
MKLSKEEQIKEEIVTAAIGVFESYGFTRVSMQDISKAGKKGRTTLYYYFGNKTEVFDAVVEKLCLQIFDTCQGVIDPNASMSTNLENFYTKKLQEIKFLTKKYHLVLEDLKQQPGLAAAKTRVLLEEEGSVIYKMIRWAIEKKEIAELTEADSRFLAETIVTAFKSFEQEIILFNRFPDMEAKLSWISQIFCKGLK